MISIMFPGPGTPQSTGAVVPIGTPVSLGSNALSTSASAITITTSAAILSGDLAVVAVGFNSATGAVSSVSDGTNTYTKALASAFSSVGSLGHYELWYKANAAAVSSGATITISFSAAAGQSGAIAARVTGIIPTSPLDVAVTNTAQTNAPSVASGTLAHANEILFSGVGGFNITSTTDNSPYTTFVGWVMTGGTQVGVDLAYSIVASTASTNYAPTLAGTNGAANFGVASFKGN